MADQRSSQRVLVVDHEETIRYLLHDLLASEGCEVRVAASAGEALEFAGEQPPAVALLDIKLPGINGLELLERLKEKCPETEVVMMTSYASLEVAIEAIRHGAYDFLQKPFDDLETTWLSVRRALEKYNLAKEKRALQCEQERQNSQLSLAVSRLWSLIEAGRAIAEFSSLPKLLDHFIGVVADKLEVDRASLMLVDPSSQELHVASARGLDDIEDLTVIRVPLGSGIAGRVAATGESFVVRDIRSDLRLNEQCAKNDLSHSFISAPVVLSVPIASRTIVLGVINVTNRRSGAAFTEDDLAYLSGLAGQLAVAIERTRHFDELQSAYETLKATKEQLVFAERMRATGQMAAGLAHDFNNLLSVILARSEFVLRSLGSAEPDPEKLRADAEAIKRSCLHGAQMIRRIQDCTRIRRDVEETAVDLNAVVRNAVDMTGPKWKEEPEARGRRVEIVFELGEIPPVRGNAQELVQVIGNLIFNAIEAMPAGGTLRFQTVADGEQVRLEVSDTGVGMNEETRRRIFEPFFTTKTTGHGLGTSIIYGIVTRHGGDISVASQPNRGTTFRVLLPAMEQMSRTESHPVRRRERERMTPVRLLFAEDDDLVRDVFVEALRMNGHDVVAVRDGDHAARRIETDRFDLVVTDLSMPGLSGFELAGLVKQHQPDTSIILLSGWAVQQDEERVRQAGIDRVLAKPCLVEELLDAVHEIVRERSVEPALSQR
ncbi:MAG: response regulator [Acidobacteriota bacterium]|nr:MAG: response regulator [Acidobacteriota bacterium]